MQTKSRKKGKKARRRTGPVPVDAAMRDASLIAPSIQEPWNESDPEAQAELETEIEEGKLRHGFRGLIPHTG
jgi:hypothetical protein